MANLKKGDIIQILRKGYYICDSPYDAANQKPIVLLNIPDGTKKDNPTGLKTTTTASSGATASGATAAAPSGPEVDQLNEQIAQQGEKVRELKANKSTPKVNYREITE